MLEDRGESERQGEVTANEVETGTKRGLKKVQCKSKTYDGWRNDSFEKKGKKQREVEQNVAVDV